MAAIENTGSILMAPPPTIARAAAQVKPGVIWRITKLAAHYPWRLGTALVLILASAVFNLMVPKLLGSAVDQAHSLLTLGPSHVADARASLVATGLLLLAVGAARGILSMIHQYQAEWISQKVAYDLRLTFFEKLQRLSFSFHDRYHSGDLITRGMIDLEGTRSFIQQGLLRIVLLIMLLGVAGYQLIRADLFIGLLALSFVPVATVLAIHSRLVLRLTWKRMQELMSILTRVMEENLQGIRVVRAFAAKTHEMAKFDETAGAALNQSFMRILLRARATRGMTLAYFCSMGLVLWFGGNKVIDGDMSVGKLAEFLAYMTILQMPVRQTGMLVNSTAQASTCGGRLFEILDLDPEIDDMPGAADLDLQRGVLRFEHVDFTYSGELDAELVLSDIDFEIGPGKTLGIVGPPGSGKSTIAHLIPRFYDVTGGRITIDGQDIRQVKLQSLRQAVGVIQQDTFLFDETVSNNVAYADPWAEDERIVDAASAAQIHDYVAALPKSYETMIGERGVSFSGGQQQRMSIARGIVPGPGIIVFDDSMSAIDAATEHRVRTAIRAVAKDKATIVVAHRLSSLMDADEILVLEDGRIAERGTHRALLAANGRYKALYELQVRPDRATLKVEEEDAELPGRIGA